MLSEGGRKMLKFGQIFDSYYTEDDVEVLSEVKLDILKLLAEFRVLNIYQMLDFMRLDNPKIKQENVYYHLQSLKKSKLIKQDDLPTNHRIKYYFLSKKGLGVLGAEYKPYRTPMYQLNHTKAVNDSILLFCQLMYEYGVNWSIQTERRSFYVATDAQKSGTHFSLPDYYIQIPKKPSVFVEVELTQKSFRRYKTIVLPRYLKNEKSVLYFTPIKKLKEIFTAIKEDWIGIPPEKEPYQVVSEKKRLVIKKLIANKTAVNSSIAPYQQEVTDLEDEIKVLWKEKFNSKETFLNKPFHQKKLKEINTNINEKRTDIENAKNEIEKIQKESDTREKEILAEWTNESNSFSKEERQYSQIYKPEDLEELQSECDRIIENLGKIREKYQERIETANKIKVYSIKDEEVAFRRLIEENI